MSTKVRWGLLAASGIAHRFVADLKMVKGAEAVAVGSRDLERAEAFADEFEIERYYGSYEQLAEDPDIEVVYVSSVHPRHYDHAKLCLDHGKAVLCEKPFTLNAREAKDLVDLARGERLFLMEAMWTRCNPLIIEIGRRIRDGEIGDLRLVHVNLTAGGLPYGFRGLDPELGGGALLECGVYPVSLAFHLLGSPTSVTAHSHFTAERVDDVTALILEYVSGALAALTTSFVMADVPAVPLNPSHAIIAGAHGWIDIPGEIFDPTEFVVRRSNTGAETVQLDRIGFGYTHEIEEVSKCVREERTESELVPLDDTLAIMRVLDEARALVGLKYPAEVM
jgi:predicted dehydrogenase